MLSGARSSLKSRRALALGNLALRQQLAVLRRQAKRPNLSLADRAFWVVLTRVWTEWRTASTIVKPATVIAWHRKGFALSWSWKSRQRGGRPRQDAETLTRSAMPRRVELPSQTWGTFLANHMPSAAAIDFLVVAPGDVTLAVRVRRPLRRVLREYMAYYHTDRTHVALDKDSLATRPVLPPGRAKVIALPRVGGLHHRYERRAA